MSGGCSGAARTRRRIFSALNLTAVVLVALLDWAMPAGIVVGLLLGVPIVLSSTADDIRELWLTSALALLAFVLAAIFGSGPVSPAGVWFPNRIIAFSSLLAFCAIAVMLHRRRRQVEQARDEAVRASALSQVLTSLLAHDLRSPCSSRSARWSSSSETSPPRIRISRATCALA